MVNSVSLVLEIITIHKLTLFAAMIPLRFNIIGLEILYSIMFAHLPLLSGHRSFLGTRMQRLFMY